MVLCVLIVPHGTTNRGDIFYTNSPIYIILFIFHSLYLSTLPLPRKNRRSSEHYLEYEKLRVFHGHGGPVWCLALDEVSGRLVSGSYDKTLKVNTNYIVVKLRESMKMHILCSMMICVCK